MVFRSFPNTRLRRLRSNATIRSLLAEHTLSASDLIYPVFVHDGSEERQEIVEMPNVYRYSLNATMRVAERAMTAGIKALALFPVISNKSETGSEAYNYKGLIPRVISMLKQNFPDLLVITDVALDPYTSHGHDGVLAEDGSIKNDETVALLCKQALCHAEAGADIVAPSDMMDGRIGKIRLTLEESKHTNTIILSYAVKYASSFYHPFRAAVKSSKLLQGDKLSYQMSIANSSEALLEAELDLAEGADILLIKPAGTCLDIITKIKSNLNVPLFAYQVSGEYAMLKHTRDVLAERECVLESLLAIKRAGACAIISYYALDVAEWLA